MTRKRVAKKAVKMTEHPSAKPSGRAMVLQPHGGALIPGQGGGPQPGSGRPKDEFKEWCRNLLDDDSNRKTVERVLKNDQHPAYTAMWKAVADRAHGKPKQSIDVTGDMTVSLIARAFGKAPE